MKPLSKRLREIPASQSVAITSKAQTLKLKGMDIISLSAGEPDFDTPDHIKAVAVKAIQSGFTKYGPPCGTPELISAIINKFKKDNNLTYNPKQIVVSSGAKQSIFNAIMALCNESDEMIIAAPYWVTYPALVKLAGGRPVIVSADSKNKFKITPEQMEQAITSKTKALILNSPANPTGSVYRREELESLAEIAVKKGIYIISDEIYEKIIYGDTPHCSIASIDKEIYNLTITVNGVSKAYAMTGWRIGYLGASEEIVALVSKFQGQTTHHPSTISMKAAEEALLGPQESVVDMTKEFARRRMLIVDRMKDIPDISLHVPEGAFYIFPDVSKYYGKSFEGGKISGSEELCNYFLEKIKIALVPGSAFGDDRCIRLSYATSTENLEKALERFKEGLQNLH